MLSDLYVSGIKLVRDIPADSYLHNLPVVRHLRDMDELPLNQPVTFLVGENWDRQIYPY